MIGQNIIYAIQGPDSLTVLSSLVDDEKLSPLPYFGFPEFFINRLPYLISLLRVLESETLS